MSVSATTWVIVLAAGDGRRLSSLTTMASGIAVPKQFCSLRGGESLLCEALRRAESIAAPEHICVVVADQHRRWWKPALDGYDPANVIVQPRNCGTAIGILLPLLHILERDPSARIVLLPSDHHVDDERALAASMRHAVRYLDPVSREILLLGILPEQADPELGYIVPGGVVEANVATVVRFVEKPQAVLAEQLIKQGALWNSFILAARAKALLQLFRARFPRVVDDMHAAIVRDFSNPGDSVATRHLYQGLAELDFSRHVLEGVKAVLRVVPVPRCGWSDLGTPTRLAETLKRMPRHREPAEALAEPLAGFLNLSVQHARLQAQRNPASQR